ncbi:uncharacterized protein LOC115877983 [Sitophilus oryzae]|uniref:Uncharacterized protein LOC115877983 n=1 Tax=Sitophilus oryzae TaxID=7048 RepID=A0A6J2XFY4_SITOR|nr:uncharacterized protein LOC115877983 [Sitophilus oryzae]
MHLKCFICSRRFSEIFKLFQHLRLWHFRGSRENSSLRCFRSSCLSTFNTFSGYKKHLIKCVLKPKVLPSAYQENTELSNITTKENNGRHNNNDSDNNANDYISTGTSNHPEPLPFMDHNIEKECESNVETRMSDVNFQIVSFISKLISNGMPVTTLVTIVQNVDELLTYIFEEIRSLLPQSADQECIVFFRDITSSIQKFNSAYKINKAFSESIVSPVNIALGVRTDQTLHRISNTYIGKNVTDTFIYIPIKNTLSTLLKNKNIQKYFTLEYVSQINSNNLETIFDGEYYKNHTFFQDNPNAIQIQLYFDEFECSAPLGSKTGIHKIGAFYFIIRNIPTIFLGKLENIHVAALFYSSDLKKYSINDILKPFVKDLQTLETEGIEVSFLPYKLKGTLVALSFDNLGGNMLSGMVESFSANYFCRMCLMHKNDTQNVFRESDDLCHLRNQDFFNTLPEIKPGSNYYGSKEKSILNELKYFNLGNTPSIDIMHDILEGVAQFEIKLIITYLVSEKKISLNEINQRIFFFNYGTIDQCTKPSPINIEKSGSSIGQRAAQTWTLTRYLPLILSDVILEVGDRWNIITFLLRIMNICFAPIIPIEMTSTLEDLICEHHLLVKQYSGNILPKHHMMIHYPNAIRKLGPLIYLWAMRFEAKHGYFKDLVQKFKNFKNIPHTLALRHQIKQAVNINSLCEIPIEMGPVKMFELNNYEFKNILIEELDLPNNVTVIETKFLKYGFLYKPSFLVCVKFNNENLPVFYEILKIVLIEEHPFFITKSWETKEFKTNLNAFRVVPDCEILLCDPKFLIYKEPYECKSVSESYYIVPKYILVKNN